MALINTLYSENNLILGFRESLWRPFNVGAWHELRIGFLCAGIGPTSVSSSCSTEYLTTSSYKDNFLFGLKTSGRDMPDEGNTNFIGVSTKSPGHYGNDVEMVNGAIGTRWYNGTTGVQLYWMTVSSSVTTTLVQVPLIGNNGVVFPPQPATSVDYNGFYGLKYTLTGSGSSAQAISMQYKNSYLGASSSAQLQAGLISNSDWYNMQYTSSMSWNDGVSALPIPDNIWIYNPFYSNRFRLSAMGIVRVV